jgi:hypothetical protein
LEERVKEKEARERAFVMSKKDKGEEMFGRLTGWMDSPETMNLEDLRSVRRMLGDDVPESEQNFLALLGTLREGLQVQEIGAEPQLKGILAAAKSIGLDAMGLANSAALSVVLVTKLDRRLIAFRSIPGQVIDTLAAALRQSGALVTDYLQQGPVLATEGRFRASEAPSLPGVQDFFDAVRSDKSIGEDRRGALLALETNREKDK